MNAIDECPWFEGPGCGVSTLARLVERRSVERVEVTHSRSFVWGALGAVVAGRTPSVTCTAWERPRCANTADVDTKVDAKTTKGGDGEDGDAAAGGGGVGWLGGVVGGAARGVGSVAGGLVRLAMGSGPRVRGKVDGVAINAGVVFQQAGSRVAYAHAFNDVVSLRLSPPP